MAVCHENVTQEKMGVVVRELYDLKDRVSIYTFEGPLGAGKTTLIQELFALWGIKGLVTSPTFAYVNIYQTPDLHTLYHFDLYRLYTLDQFIDLGFSEYLYAPNSWSFIEWPHIIQPLLTERVCVVQIDYDEKETRTISYELKESCSE